MNDNDIVGVHIGDDATLFLEIKNLLKDLNQVLIDKGETWYRYNVCFQCYVDNDIIINKKAMLFTTNSDFFSINLPLSDDSLSIIPSSVVLAFAEAGVIVDDNKRICSEVWRLLWKTREEIPNCDSGVRDLAIIKDEIKAVIEKENRTKTLINQLIDNEKSEKSEKKEISNENHSKKIEFNKE